MNSAEDGEWGSYIHLDSLTVIHPLRLIAETEPADNTPRESPGYTLPN